MLEYMINLLKDEDLIEFIAENTYEYYLEQNTDKLYTESLRQALEDIDKSISNLVRAIEQSIFNEATKNRMDELEEQKEEIKSALAAARLKENLGITKERILFFCTSLPIWTIQILSVKNA